MEIKEQDKVLENDKKNMLVSASAGSGKTYVMIKYLSKLICDDKIPISHFLVLTFTKAAASQMKDKLLQSLKEKGSDEYIVEQIDALSTSNISTIHSFCEKYIKKYSNLLGLNENFSILDENMSKKIKEMAFDQAMKNFQIKDSKDYLSLQGAFKNNDGTIKDIIFKIEEISVAVADKDKFLKENVEKSEEFFEKSCNFLVSYVKNEIETALNEIDKLHVEDFSLLLKNKLVDILSCNNIYFLCEKVEDFSFPRLPTKKMVGDFVVEKLNVYKDKINDALDVVKDLNISEEQKKGTLEKILIKFFEDYQQEQDRIKKSQNYLDFSDLERYMNILSQKENLFSGFEYVFVDEYQDTNKIQEKIIKNVAKNCNFVAVGDLKQGIYGFRLASSQIFLKDLEEFENDDDSAVNYLHCNFRSRKKILNFINNVFKKVMIKEETGVDYENTSMLDGVIEFKDEAEKAVFIDLVDPIKEEKETNEDVYDIKTAELFEKNNKSLLHDIKRRLLEVLSTKISDDGNLRQVRFSDIAILARKRDDFFNNLENFLRESGFPIISNSRSKLLEQPEIQMLLNLLKIILNFDDELQLLSVLTGGIFRFTLSDISKRKGLKNLTEIVKNDDFFANFLEKIEKIKTNYQIFGIKHTLEELFLETDYRTYINQTNPSVMPFVDKFLDEVEAFDFDLPSAINYFENVEIDVTPEVSVVEDSVLLTTIHNSKGLEYPIVFLINCDQSLSKSKSNSEVKIDENFGLAVKFKSIDTNEEFVTPRMKAISISQKQKDFVEEIMIFYVALTRAKNRLYLFGEYKNSFFNKQNVRACDCYFDFIFYALPEIKNEFLKDDKFESDVLEILHIDKVEEEQIPQKEEIVLKNKNPEILNKIKSYLNFSYSIDDNLNYRLKEGVTSLTKKQIEEPLTNYNNESFNFNTNVIEVGNAYHSALKAICFDKIQSLKDLERELQKNQDMFDVGLIDKQLLLKDILTLKKFTSEGKVFKEKEFLLKEKLSNLVDSNSDDEILVQGVIDLFVIKEKEIVLIDYKYTHNDQLLLKKYKQQIKLYKIALERAYNLPVLNCYLFSLRTNSLFKVEF